MSFIIQRIYEGAGDEGQDVRETLARGFGDPDAALAHIQKQFKAEDEDPDIDVNVTYNNKTKRFAIIPSDYTDLLYHIVALNEVDLINE